MPIEFTNRGDTLSTVNSVEALDLNPPAPQLTYDQLKRCARQIITLYHLNAAWAVPDKTSLPYTEEEIGEVKSFIAGDKLHDGRDVRKNDKEKFNEEEIVFEFYDLAVGGNSQNPWNP
jgi:hypothetical protein